MSETETPTPTPTPAPASDVPPPAVAQTATASSSTLTLVFGWTVYILAVAAVLVVGWVVMYRASVRLSPDPQRDARLAAAKQQQLEAERQIALSEATPLDPQAVSRGEGIYATACAACHGPDARGRPYLGKDLVTRAWVRKMTDKDIADLIIAGRAANDPLNTTHIPMPPRGARMDLTDSEVGDIVVYLRSLQRAAR